MKKYLSLSLVSVSFLMVFVVANNAMAVVPSQGPNNGSNFSNQSSGGSNYNWINTSNAISSNDQYATADIITSGHETDYLKVKGFGFSIPAGATINGIVVTVEKKQSCIDSHPPCSSDVTDYVVRLVKNDSITGSDKANTTTAWGITDSVASYGSFNDLWGTTWSVSDVNNVNFGVDFSAKRSSGGDRRAYVDQIRAIVYYTPALSNQTISVTTHAPANAIYGSTFSVAATASSSLAVAITTTGGCSISGGTVTMTSGTTACVVHYNQAGNGSYNAASEITETTLAQPKNLTVTGIVAQDKHYDQTTSVTLDTSGAALVGVIGTDDLALNFSGMSGVFDNKNIGLGKTVTISGITLSGSTASNYTLTQPTSTAKITERNTSATATGVNKVYDGNTSAQVVMSFDTIPGDDISYDHVNITAAFEDPSIGVNKVVHVDHIYLTGTDALNYNLLAGFADTTANITQDPASITLDKSNLSRTYDGNPQTVGVLSTSPTGLSNIVLYNGSTTAPTVAGSYSVLGVITDPQYSGTDSATLLINKKDQTITFGALAEKTYGDEDFSVSATADSGLVVIFGVSGNCSLVGTTVHITGAGSCTVTASQAGDVNYAAASDVPQIFNVNKKVVNVTADAKTKFVGEVDPALTFTHNSLVGEDSFSGVLARDPGEIIGTYPITQGTLALSDNYTLNFTGANFTIADSSPQGGGGGQLTYTPPSNDKGNGGSGNESGGNTPPPITEGNNPGSGTQTGGQVLGAQTFQFTRTLKLGMKGDDVLELHKKLAALGFYKGPVDNMFGPLLKAAVKVFQKANPPLKVDGVVGLATIILLNK